MQWWPSRDETIQKEISTSFWNAIEPIFDNSCHLKSLPRWDWENLKNKYISERKFDEFFDMNAMRSRLPKELLSIPLGPQEVDLIDFILNYNDGDRTITLEGPRGAGKTSLLHYIEAAIYESGYKAFPIFLIVDCLTGEKNITRTELVGLLKEEIVNLLQKVKEPIKSEFKRLEKNIENDMTFSGVKKAFHELSLELSKEQFSRIVLVFDNLDQNYLDSVCYGIELAKELYLTTGIATITCLRPGCLEAIMYRGDARAFFNYKIKITAPKTIKWLESLGPRLKKGADDHISSTGNVLRAYDKKIRPERIQSAVNSWISLLSIVSEKYEDNIIDVLDIVAADDIRHLLLATRRIFSHRGFPGKWALGFDDKFPEYHPLRSLFEGSSMLFKKNKVIPNLLGFYGNTGKCDFLIAHRILLLLSSADHKFPQPTNKLLKILGTLGHEKKIAVKCLSILHSLLLVRSTNAEFIDPKGKLPAAVFLTDSGLLYLNHIISIPAYPLTAVMDIQQNHTVYRKISQQTFDKVPFASQVDSFLEYIEIIKIEEAGQINKLLASDESSLTILPLYLLKYGGLFVHSLVKILYSIYDSTQYSKVTSAYQTRESIKNAISSCEEWIEEREADLTKEYESRISRKEILSKSITLDTTSELLLTQIGNDVSISAEFNIEEKCENVFVGLTGKIDNKDISIATIAEIKQDNLGSNVIAKFRPIPEAATADFDSFHTNTVVSTKKIGKSFGLLSMNCLDSKSLQLQLDVLNHDKNSKKTFEIGKQVAIEDLKKLSNTFFKEMATSAITESISKETLMIMGTKLANQTLTKEGHNILASHFKLIDTLLVFSSEKNLTIPWEWLRPQPVSDHLEVPIIGDIWNIIRWPVSKESDIISGLSSLSMSSSTAKVDNLCTIGLGKDSKYPWRDETPKTFTDLRNRLISEKTVHLVGHYDVSSNVIKIGDLSITKDAINAFPLSGPSTIIISACEAGGTIPSENIAVSISKKSQIITWAPLVLILEKSAEDLDENLYDFCTKYPEKSIEEFMTECKKDNPFYNLYLKFGVH